MTTKFELEPGESILIQSAGSHIKGKMNVAQGKVILTDRRLVFAASPIWATMFGLIGALIAMKMSGKVTLELKLDDIQSWQRTKYGLNKNVLQVNTSGEEVKLAVSKFQKWEPFMLRVKGAPISMG